MGEDIGPGDVVEYVDAVHPYPGGVIIRGDRRVIDAIAPIGLEAGECMECGLVGGAGYYLVGIARGRWPWCPNHWRKIGPSRSETVRLFAEDLNVERPKVGA